jgi:hypothetical protein
LIAHRGGLERAEGRWLRALGVFDRDGGWALDGTPIGFSKPPPDVTRLFG